MGVEEREGKGREGGEIVTVFMVKEVHCQGH